jgi:hypothetical protein
MTPAYTPCEMAVRLLSAEISIPLAIGTIHRRHANIIVDVFASSRLRELLTGKVYCLLDNAMEMHFI